MAEAYSLTVRPEWPGLISLDWERPLKEWRDRRMVELPRGISRHQVRFIALEQGTFALKELPERPCRRDYDALRRLEELGGSSVKAAGVVVRQGVDAGSEEAAVLITRYLDYSFSYRELLQGEGFGLRASRCSTRSPSCSWNSTCWAASGETARSPTPSTATTPAP